MCETGVGFVYFWPSAISKTRQTAPLCCSDWPVISTLLSCFPSVGRLHEQPTPRELQLHPLLDGLALLAVKIRLDKIQNLERRALLQPVQKPDPPPAILSSATSDKK